MRFCIVSETFAQTRVQPRRSWRAQGVKRVARGEFTDPGRKSVPGGFSFFAIKRKKIMRSRFVGEESESGRFKKLHVRQR